jgi:hypothetical protein
VTYLRQFNLNFNFVCAANVPLCADVASLNVALPELWDTTVHATNSFVSYLNKIIPISLTSLAGHLPHSPCLDQKTSTLYSALLLTYIILQHKEETLFKVC